MSIEEPDNAHVERRDRFRFVTLTWAHLLNDGASNYLPGVLPAILISLHDPVRMAGGLMATLIAGQALQPVSGWLADRLGGRSLVVTGLFLTSLGGSLLGVAHSTDTLIVLLFVIGIGSSLFHPQALAGVRSTLRVRPGLVTSVFLVGGELGRGLWPTVASFMVANFGLNGLWVMGIPGLLTLPLLRHAAPRLATAPPQQRIRWRRHRRELSLLLGYSAIRALATYTLVTFVPITWHLRGGSLVGGASVITTMITVGVVGNLWGGHMADRLGRRPILVASALGVAVLTPPMAYLGGAWLWIVAALLGAMLFLSASSTILIGQDIFPENRSMGSGMALGFTNGIGALFVFLIGLGLTNRDVSIVFWLAAALSLVSTLLALALSSDLMESRHRAASS
ncbi:MAG: MFS transporter [Acidimicrobiales bacterium]